MYPQYAWTPDGSAIVIWGEGKIWKVDAASGAATPCRSPRASSRRQRGACGFPQKVPPTSSPSACCATCGSPDGKTRRLQRPRAGSTSSRCPTGQPRRLTKEDRLEFRRRSRATASGLSTRRGRTPSSAGCASCVRTARPGATWSRRPGTTPSRRSRRTARRSCSGRSAATDARAVLRRRRRRLRRPGWPAASRCSSATAETAVRSHRHAHLLREVRNEKSTLLSVGLPTGDSPLPGRDEIEHVPATTPRSTRSRPTASGSPSRSASSLHRPVPAHRPAGRHRAGDQAYPGAARLPRRRLLPALVRRQPARLLGAGPELFSRDVGRHLRVARAGAQPAPARRTDRRQRRAHRVHAPGRQPAGRSPWSAPASSPWPA